MYEITVVLSLDAVKSNCLRVCSKRDFWTSHSIHTDWKLKDQGSGGGCGGKFAKLTQVLFENIQINDS